MSVAKVSASKFNKAPIAPMAKRRSIFRTLPHKKVELVDLSTIHERERWIYENPAAMKSLLKGLEQSKRGEVQYIGDFTQYLDDEDWAILSKDLDDDKNEVHSCLF